MKALCTINMLIKVKMLFVISELKIIQDIFLFGAYGKDQDPQLMEQDKY
jgi:hypothetical protein